MFYVKHGPVAVLHASWSGDVAEPCRQCADCSGMPVETLSSPVTPLVLGLFWIVTSDMHRGPLMEL